MNRDYVFEDINVLAKLIMTLSKKPITPLRIQKNLYFLFAFYGATLGKLSKKDEIGIFEGTESIDGEVISYPKYLFKENIEAWQYGPVVKEVYHTYKRTQEIENSEEWIPKNPSEVAIKDLLEQVIKQTDNMGDFALVERTHEDNAWRKAYKTSGIIDKDEIIEEYTADVF